MSGNRDQHDLMNFSQEETRKKKKKTENLFRWESPLMPTAQSGTKTQFHFSTRQKLQRGSEKQNNWKRIKEIETPCHCTGWKSVAKDSRLRVAAPDPRNIDNPSVWMSYWSAPLCCHTHPVFAPRKLKKGNNHKMYVSDGCERAVHRSRFPMQIAPNFKRCKLPAKRGNGEKRNVQGERVEDTICFPAFERQLKMYNNSVQPRSLTCSMA